MLEEYVLKKAQELGADDAIVTSTTSSWKQVKFVNNEVAVVQDWSSNNLSLFIALKKRLVFTDIDLSKSTESIEDHLKRIIKIAKLMKPKEDYEGIAEGPFKYKRIKEGYDKKILNLDGEEINLAQSAINSALENNAERCSGVLYSGFDKLRLISTNGADVEDKGTFINISIRAFGRKTSGHSVEVSRTLKKFNPEKAGQEAGFLAGLNLSPKQGKAGKYKTILSHMTAANLFYYMSYAFSAFQVDAGFSFLEGKLGKKVASHNLSLYDDGLLPNGFYSRKFDDEGRPTQKTTIIDKGILKNFLHNTSTAKKFKAKPTSNAGIINPHPWNLFLKPGKKSSEKLIDELEHGLLVTNVWYTRFSNYRTGDFSTIPRDALLEIKNGEIVGNLTGLRISDNMQSFLMKIAEISKDIKSVEWWEVETPVVTGHILVENLNFTRSER